jgi:hypothetical protein
MNEPCSNDIRAFISQSCVLYGARRCVIESLRALKRLLPTCSIVRQTASTEVEKDCKMQSNFR